MQFKLCEKEVPIWLDTLANHSRIPYKYLQVLIQEIKGSDTPIQSDEMIRMVTAEKGNRKDGIYKDLEEIKETIIDLDSEFEKEEDPIDTQESNQQTPKRKIKTIKHFRDEFDKKKVCYYIPLAEDVTLEVNLEKQQYKLYIECTHKFLDIPKFVDFVDFETPTFEKMVNSYIQLDKDHLLFDMLIQRQLGYLGICFKIDNTRFKELVIGEIYQDKEVLNLTKEIVKFMNSKKVTDLNFDFL
eukprot:gene6535-10542_t